MRKNAISARDCSVAGASRRAATIGLGLLCSLGVQAQQPPQAGKADAKPAEGVQTIVITATKRSENVQNVAGAVTAISGDALAERGLLGSIELLNQVPSADLQMNNGSTAANIFLRGIGTKGPGYNQVGAIGVYTDEISLGSPIVNVLQLFDLERVEVLRGPQNTLYGMNTTGGAMNFVSRRPEFGAGPNGYATLTAGNYSELDGEAALGFDIGNKAAGRASFLTQHRGGMYNDVYTGTRVYDRDTSAARLQLGFAPSSTVNVLLRGHAEAVDNTNKLWKTVGLRSPVPVVVGGVRTFPNPCTDTIGLGSACVSANGSPTDPKDHTTFSASLRDPIEKVDAQGLSATVNWDLPIARLTYIGAYEHNKYKKAEDADAGPAPLNPRGPFSAAVTNANFSAGFDFFQVSQAEQWTNELRLTSPSGRELRWIAGLYALRDHTLGNTTAVPYNNIRANSTRLDQHTTVYSGYGEVERDFTNRLTGIIGARVTYEKIDGSNTTVQRVLNDAAVANAILPTNGQNPISTADLLALPVGAGRNVLVDAPYGKSWTQQGWKVGGKYRISDAAMAYGDVSQGFKAGSFAAGPAQSINGTFFSPVNPEFLTAYQAGIKSTLLNKRLTINVSGFYYKYKDQQLLKPGFDQATASITTALVNAGRSHLSGFDLESQWAPGGGWNAGLAIGYLKTRIDEFKQAEACAPSGVGDCAANGIRTTDYAGNELMSAPKWTMNAILHKEFVLQNGMRLGLGGDITHKSSRYFTMPNNPLEADSAYTTLNLQASIKVRGAYGYRITFWGKNVSNRLFYLIKGSTAGNTGVQEVLISDPRTVGVTVSAAY